MTIPQVPQVRHVLWLCSCETSSEGTIISAVVIALALYWVNSRIAMVRANQDPASPLVLSAYPIYHSMATGLREGRLGQVDLLAVSRYRWP